MSKGVLPLRQPSPQQMLTKGRDLYFIRNPITGYVKIGVSNDTARRVREIECAAGVRLEILAVFLRTGWAESHLHAVFAADRILGEWFTPARIVELLGNPQKWRDYCQSVPNELIDWSWLRERRAA